jgi:energy-coupling factor transporter ATP-binding protein EcfA2
VFSADDGDTFPRVARFDTPLDYSYFSLASRDEDESSTGLGALPLGRALLDLIRDESKLLNRTRFKIFQDIVDPVLPLALIHLPLRRRPRGIHGIKTDENGRLWTSLSNVPSSEQARLTLAAAVDTSRELALIDSDSKTFPPSSGQRVYLRFATLALSVISQGSLIVLDEPETHLHPNFISEFMNLLHELLIATSSIALVATHSPYVVREVPTACVHVVERDANVPSIGKVHLKTLGASVSSISDAVFGDATVTKFHRILAEKLSAEGKAVSNTESERIEWLITTFGPELNAEMLSTIRFMMSNEAGDSEVGDDDA